MIITIEEYKEKIRTLQKQISNNMKIQWNSNAGWVNGVAVPNFCVTKKEEKNGFLIEAKALITVSFIVNEKVKIDFYPSDVESEEFLPHIENILEKEISNILSYVNGYID